LKGAATAAAFCGSESGPMIRYGVPIVLLASLSLVGFWATASRDRPAAFTYANRGDVVCLDIAQMTYVQDMRIARALWEGLCGYAPDGTTVVEGAAYFPPEVSADGRTYTFHIRPEARWSNGDPVTAHDFAYAWRRAIEPGTAGDYSFLFRDNIEGAREYWAWRMTAVSTLTPMRKLARGQPVDADEGLRLRLYVPAERAGAVYEGLPERPDDGASDAEKAGREEAWSVRCGELLRLGAAYWEGLADRLLAAHRAEMEERYARVGWQVLDDHTLRVRLRRRTPYFPDLCAFATLFPVHRVSLHRLWSMTPEGLCIYDTQWPKPDYHRGGYPGLVGNGPYRMREWKFKRYILLEKNPYYWDADRVRIPTVKIVAYESPNTAFLAYERGQVDWLAEVGGDFTPELIGQHRAGLRPDIQTSDAFGTSYYTINCRPRLADGSPNPFADRRVRVAFALALDKKAIVESVVKCGNRVAATFVPPDSVPGYRGPAGLGYDPARARMLLAEAGWPGGRGFPTVELLTGIGSDYQKNAEATAKMWQDQLGVRCKLRVLEARAFRDAVKQGRFMLARVGWYGDYLDPLTFLDMLQTGNGNNDAKWSDPRYDDLLEQAARASDPQERLRILARAEALAMEEELPFLPVYHYVHVSAQRAHVRGLQINHRLIHPLKYVWLER